MKRRTKNLFVASLAAATTCLFGAALLPKTVTAEQQSVVQSSYSFYNNVNKTDYDGVHYSAFDALSVNFPSTLVNGIVSVGFPFESTDMTATNAAIRIRVQTVAPVTGSESLRFDLVGASTLNMKTNATIYKEQNGAITTAEVIGSGTSAAFYAIDTAEVNSTKAFNGHLVFPISTWSDSATGITSLNIRTNPLHTKSIWNFGNVEYGTVDANGAFTASKTLWTAFDAQGNANAYTADSSVDAALVKANTMEGTAKSFYLKTKLNDAAANNASYSTSDYDGIVVHVDNTGSAARSFQYYVWDSATTSLGTPSYGWLTKNGLAYFMPDEDCTAFENSSAYRSSFIPAGFKGEMYVPFTVNSEAESGAWQANTNAGTTFPTAICNQVYVYTTNTEASFGIGAPSLVEDGNTWMAEAFGTTSSVNLGAIDDTKALMIQQKADTVSSQYELQPGNKGNVAFSTVNSGNEVITGGAALALSVENLQEEPFKLQLTTYNQGSDRVVLGGNVASAKVTFTNVDGSVQLLDCVNGYVSIPAYAKGTLMLSYVGGTPSALSQCTYALGYPTGNIFRIYFATERTSGAKLPVAYLVGDIAVVNGNGTHTVLTVSGTSVINLAATDTSYRIERTNIAYSGTLKYSTASYEACENATISVDKTSVRYNGEVTYTVNSLVGVEAATLNGVDVTEGLVENEGVYTYTTRIKEDSTFAVTLLINDSSFYYEGASIRLSSDADGDGIRFSMLMTKELYDQLTANGNVPVFGTLLIPEDMKTGELTKDTAYVSDTTTNNILMNVTIEGVEYIRWTVYLWGVPEMSRSRGFCARGYINIDGTYFYTAEKAARSISWVAQQAYADSTISDAVKDLCKKYLPKVTFDLGGAEGTVESVTLYDAVTYVLPTLETLGITAPEGKTLVGYSVYGTTYNVGDTVIINGNVTVTLVWEEN